MTQKPKPAKARRYADDAPLTKKELATGRPIQEALPQLAAAYRAGTLRMPDGRRVGRPSGSDKTSIALRVDNDVLSFFKSRGNGWQTRINAVLRAVVDATQGAPNQ